MRQAIIVHFPGAKVSRITLRACPNAWRFRVRPGRATSISGSSQILASLTTSGSLCPHGRLPTPHNEHRSCETRRSGHLLPGFFGLIRLSLLRTRNAQNHNEVQRLALAALLGGSSLPCSITKVNLTVAKAAFLQKLKLQAKVVRERWFAASHDDRFDE
jgi:hypothetical protein